MKLNMRKSIIVMDAIKKNSKYNKALMTDKDLAVLAGKEAGCVIPLNAIATRRKALGVTPLRSPMTRTNCGESSLEILHRIETKLDVIIEHQLVNTKIEGGVS
jgi:hypothetical protein